MPISLRDDFPPTTMGNPLITAITPLPPTPSLRPMPSYKTRTLPPLPPPIPSSQNHHLILRHPLTPHSHYRRRSFQTQRHNEYHDPSPPRNSAPAVVGGVPYEMQAMEFTPVSEFSSDSEDDDGPGRYLLRTKTLAKDVLFPRKGGNKLRSRKGPGPDQPQKASKQSPHLYPKPDIRLTPPPEGLSLSASPPREMAKAAAQRRVHFDGTDKVYPATMQAPSRPAPRPASLMPVKRVGTTVSVGVGPVAEVRQTQLHQHEREESSGGRDERPRPPEKDWPLSNSKSILIPEATSTLTRYASVIPRSRSRSPAPRSEAAFKSYGLEQSIPPGSTTPQNKATTRDCSHHASVKRKDPGTTPSIPDEAVSLLPPLDAEAMRKRCRQEAARLKEKQGVAKKKPADENNNNNTSGLHQYLAHLDQRYEEIRKIRNVLCDNRRLQHQKILAYLRDADEREISKENLMKYEESMGLLEAAIEEWQRRLEKTQRRRIKVKERLAEASSTSKGNTVEIDRVPRCGRWGGVTNGIMIASVI